MIRCTLTAEPPHFDAQVRRPGQQWQAKNPHKPRPRDFWSCVVEDLANAFHHRCAYLAIEIGRGQVDHFVSCQEDRNLAYEWTNYRYCDPNINSRKNRARACDLLDPCAIEDDWFELILPSLQVRVTDRCPPELRERANHTLVRLGLRDGEAIIRMRSKWLALYDDLGADRDKFLVLLDQQDPMLARALRKRDASVT